jgi:accessory colonization factor AcfC
MMRGGRRVEEVETQLQQGENSARVKAWTLWVNWKLSTPAQKAAAEIEEHREYAEIDEVVNGLARSSGS